MLNITSLRWVLVGELEEAYKAYEQLLTRSSFDIEKSDLLLSLGLVCYQLHGLEAAQAFLLEGCDC